MEGREEEKIPMDERKPTIDTTTTKFDPRAGVAVAADATAQNPLSVPIRNPYANRKNVSKTINATDNINGISSLSTEIISATKTTNNPSNATAQKFKTEAAFTNPRIHDHSETQQPAYWERLPSRTVSFTSAEILTITECLKDGQHIAKLYHDEGRSVRLTGILHHRSFRPLEESMDTPLVVEMDVKDPITTTTKAAVERIRAKNSGTVASSTPYRKRPRPLPTPAKLSFTPKTFGTTPNIEQKRLQRNKRPWFVNSGLRGRKSDKIIEKIPPTPTELKIIVDARSVVGADTSLKAAVVGSFITVIGEFVLASAVDIPSKNEDVDRGDINPAPRYQLEARTLLVINNHLEGSNGRRATTDSAFYEKALTLRRKTMYERYHYRSPSEKASDDRGEGDRPVLLQGCGPPPYDTFDRELAQKSFEDSKTKETKMNPS